MNDRKRVNSWFPKKIISRDQSAILAPKMALPRKSGSFAYIKRYMKIILMVFLKKSFWGKMGHFDQVLPNGSGGPVIIFSCYILLKALSVTNCSTLLGYLFSWKIKRTYFSVMCKTMQITYPFSFGFNSIFYRISAITHPPWISTP